MTAEQLAQFFHETYERLAPEYGYKTREASAKPWADVPAQNKSLMIAVAREVLCILWGENFVKWQEQSAKDYEKYLADAEIQAAKLARICACGHAVSEHMEMPLPDGTPMLLCTVNAGCEDVPVQGFRYSIPRCSVPTEVID